MITNKSLEIERKIFMSDFYMNNFSSTKEAASYLNIFVSDLENLFEIYDTNLKSFIFIMRIEDLKEYIIQNPMISLSVIATKYKFKSLIYLLYYFYKLEGCSLASWRSRNCI